MAVKCYDWSEYEMVEKEDGAYVSFEDFFLVSSRLEQALKALDDFKEKENS